MRSKKQALPGDISLLLAQLSWGAFVTARGRSQGGRVREGGADADNAGAARKHLIAAGLALRNSDWAGRVPRIMPVNDGGISVQRVWDPETIKALMCWDGDVTGPRSAAERP